jgi:autotransporter-associated beta strand protein
MGFLKRTENRFPFAPTGAAMVLCAMMSTALHASIVPIPPRGDFGGSITFGGVGYQAPPEVASLLAINPTGPGNTTLFEAGLGKVLQDAWTLGGETNPMLFKSDALVLSDSGSNGTSLTNAGGILQSNNSDFPRAFGVGAVDMSNTTVTESLMAAAADHWVFALGDRNTTGVSRSADFTPSIGSMGAKGPETRTMLSSAVQSRLENSALAGPGSITPDAITATFIWDGGGADNNVTTAQNWVGDTLPGANSDIIWAGTTRLNVNVDVGGPANSYTFDNTAGAFVLSGVAFSIANGITNNSTATQTINNAITLTLAQTWSAASGNLVFGGNIANGGFLLTIGGGANTSASGIISGTGGLTKSGTGRLTLTGANTYTGTTTVSAGVLNLQNATGLGTIAGGTTVTSGAALQLQGGIAVGNEALTLNGTGITSDGALRNISGNNSWAGLITINSTTRINSDSGTLTLDVASGNAITGSNDDLQFGGAGNITINDVIATGTGTLTKDGTGILFLNAANTYTGATTVSAGILNVQNATGLGTIAAGTTVSNGATLQLQGGITIGSESLNIRGVGASGQNGALVNVSGTNNYGGLITLAGATTFSSNSGILNLTHTGTITGATFGLTLTGSGNGTVASIIGTTSGSLTKSGTGTWTLTGANTFTGSTTVSGGTLTLAGSSGAALGFTSGITVNSGATLLLGGNNQINNIAGLTLNGGTFARGSFSEGTLSAAGLGALSLSGAGSHLDFGTGAVGILTFASFAPGAFSLTIDNWTGGAASLGGASTDRLIFGSNQSGNLTRFNFTGFGSGAVQFDLGNGFFEITPVPEAGTWFSGLVVLALILFHHRGPLRQLAHRRRASRKARFSPVHGTGVAS